MDKKSFKLLNPNVSLEIKNNENGMNFESDAKVVR